jgi:hypothetical protein
MKAAKVAAGLPLLGAGVLASSVLLNYAGPAVTLCAGLALGHMAMMAGTPDKGWGWFIASAMLTLPGVATLAALIGFPWWAAWITGGFFVFLSWLAALATSTLVGLVR